MTKRQIIYVQFTEDKILKFVFGLKKWDLFIFTPVPISLLCILIAWKRISHSYSDAEVISESKWLALVITIVLVENVQLVIIIRADILIRGNSEQSVTILKMNAPTPPCVHPKRFGILYLWSFPKVKCTSQRIVANILKQLLEGKLLFPGYCCWLNLTSTDF